MALFELLNVALTSEEWGTHIVPPDARGGEPVELPEGAVLTVALTFRVAEAIDGLAVEETRRYGGNVIGTTRTALGGFRAGGPYEIQLPSERLPVGRASCGTYEVTARFVAADGRELARESHRFRIVHRPSPAAPAMRTRGATGRRTPEGTSSAGPRQSRRAQNPRRSEMLGEGHVVQGG
ncbi:hypothetical protein OG361_40035 [Streptomyces sp. NBC_00090]|uniref:hypothetical protein n=1 Tax=Streptomyces sp. NBC_00090 TaxID=2903619 RepID=UPI003252E2CD